MSCITTSNSFNHNKLTAIAIIPWETLSGIFSDSSYQKRKKYSRNFISSLPQIGFMLILLPVSGCGIAER
jgi:hypothetical protein